MEAYFKKGSESEIVNAYAEFCLILKTLLRSMKNDCKGGFDGARAFTQEQKKKEAARNLNIWQCPTGNIDQRRQSLKFIY